LKDWTPRTAGAFTPGTKETGAPSFAVFAKEPALSSRRVGTQPSRWTVKNYSRTDL